MARKETNNEVMDQLIGSLDLKGKTHEELLRQNGMLDIPENPATYSGFKLPPCTCFKPHHFL